MELQKVNYNVNDGIATITMNSPENLNAVDEQMAEDLIEALNQSEKDESVKVILIRSNGKAFSAGGDIGFLYKQLKTGKDLGLEKLNTLVGELARVSKTMSKIIIAEVNGAAAGAGCSLALCADIIVAEENAKFIMAFVNMGLATDTGGAYLLSKQIGEKRALSYCLTGRPISAKEALELGIVAEIFPTENLQEETQKITKHFSNGPLIAYEKIKKQIFESNYKDFERYLKEVEWPAQKFCSETEDFREGVSAFAEKRKPKFFGR